MSDADHTDRGGRRSGAPNTGECRPRMGSARTVSTVRTESRSVSRDATSLCDARGLRFGHGAISAQDFRHLALAGIATKFERRSPHHGQVGFVSGSGPSAIRMRMSVDGASETYRRCQSKSALGTPTKYLCSVQSRLDVSLLCSGRRFLSPRFTPSLSHGRIAADASARVEPRRGEPFLV